MASRQVFVFGLLWVAPVVGVTPVQKVIEMLSGMLAKGKAEKHDEQVQFAAFKQFCDDTSTEKTRNIKAAGEAIDMLKADIQKTSAEADRLGKETVALDSDIITYEGDLKAAQKVREIEHADYVTTHQDYTESLNALDDAIELLKSKAKDTPQASAVLAQVKAFGRVPERARHAIDAFLETEKDPELDVSAPQAAAYEFRSAGIIDMLQKLKDKFLDERTVIEKEEMNARHAHDVLVQDLKADIKAAEAAKTAKTEEKAKNLQANAEAKGDLQDTTSAKESDTKYLAELSASCSTKAGDFEERQTLRTDELAAIEKAIEILSGDTVSGAAEKHLPTMFTQRQTALAQLRSSDKQDPHLARAAAYVNEQAKRTGSRVLSALAVRLQEDPFAKVKKMIKDLIMRLMSEAAEEADHKGWCDTELTTNEQTRKEKSAAVETLQAEIVELNAGIAKLGEEVAELSESVAAIDKAVAEETKLRAEEKAKNAATVQDAQEAQAAVAQAVTVLREFYAKAATATALMQKGRQPEVFDAPYKGMAAESGGVIGMLEVIQSDFARLESEVSSAEATATESHDTSMTEAKVNKAAMSKDIEHKSNEKQTKEQTVSEKTADLETTQNELNAALAYFEKLKPSCLDAGVTYEERTARRKEEIQTLQEALRILNGEDIAALNQQ